MDFPSPEPDPKFEANYLERTLLSNFWSEDVKVAALGTAIGKGVELPLAAFEELIQCAEKKILAEKREGFQRKYLKCEDDVERIVLVATYSVGKTKKPFLKVYQTGS